MIERITNRSTPYMVKNCAKFHVYTFVQHVGIKMSNQLMQPFTSLKVHESKTAFSISKLRATYTVGQLQG